MSVECVAFWYIDLPGGNCADWFSGTMSALAVALAAGSYSFSEVRLRRERREREKVVARTIGIKVFRLMNESTNLLNHLRPTNSPPDSSVLKLEYRYVYPIVGIYFDPSFALDPAEIDLLTRAGDSEFLSDLMLSLERHRSVVEALLEYKVRYEALQAMMPAPVKAEGLAMTYALSKEQVLALAPYQGSLNHFLNATVSTLRENVVKVGGLSPRYTRVMKKHLKLQKWLSFEIDQEKLNRISKSI